MTSRLTPTKDAGFTLVETVIAMAMLSFLLLAALASIEWGTIAAVRSREELRGSRLAQMIHTRLAGMDFYNVFACNSSQPNYGLWSSFQEVKALQELHNSLQSAGFTHFSIDVTFMRRDSSDSNSNGLISDLIPFQDANNDRVDDFDPNIRFFDQNGDGDFYDSYMVGSRRVAEQPDTHIKLLTVKIWKGNQTVAIKQGELLSAEQFSGIENPSSEAALQLNITSPENGAVLYRLITSTQISANNLTISKSYPPTTVAYRVDSASSLRLQGDTEPAATVNIRLGLPSNPTRESFSSDFVGNFDAVLMMVTGDLVEGTNILYGQTIKSTLSSPFAEKQYVYDFTPPAITNQTPPGAAKTLSPYVGCTLLDGVGSTTTVSGISQDVISFFNGASTVPYTYDPTTGRLAWLDPDTLLPPVLTDGNTYTVTAEGGDKAFYKVKRTWSFTVAPDNPDNSAPSLSNRTPIGVNAPTLPMIGCRVSDNQSGVIPASIVLTVDGTVVVSSAATPVLGRYYDASTGQVSYVPAVPFAPGTTHTVTIHAEHWAANPAAPDKRYLDPLYDPNAGWTFVVAP
ncbi:MAG: prepilin-type N-terminal cleavage/methylation domain-containing protein [Elusimicrobia bacterium]|nr:prepilin-type N-terminal cleavage/methylation domain-containing protein [Elusimicrobiota bacterium]